MNCVLVMFTLSCHRFEPVFCRFTIAMRSCFCLRFSFFIWFICFDWRHAPFVDFNEFAFRSEDNFSSVFFFWSRKCRVSFFCSAVWIQLISRFRVAKKTAFECGRKNKNVNWCVGRKRNSFHITSSQVIFSYARQKKEFLCRRAVVANKIEMN